jgi:glyoxylase-like metal-dependent hydrolase (beta-lactamase superfamily II)
MIKVHVFHTGAVKVDQAIPLHEKNPLAVTGLLRGEDKKMILPVSCYLIEHPKGNILIDTGWDTKYADIRPIEKMGMVDKISGPIIRHGEGVDDKLKELGLSDTDLKAVYLSHMDFDHTSGLRLVKHAQGFYASKEEIEDAGRLKLRYVDTWTGIVMSQLPGTKVTGLQEMI